MEWYNEPQSWSTDSDRITIKSEAKTDFWRKTHHDFVRDNGHFYYQLRTGDFVAEVKITGHYSELYDQAGLMVRVNEEHWIKTGVELIDGNQYVSAVVTHDYSDWSVVPLPNSPPSLWLRATRQGSAIEVHYSVDGAHFALLRLAYLSQTESVQVGPMCASPEGDGFAAEFQGLKISSVDVTR